MVPSCHLKLSVEPIRVPEVHTFSVTFDRIESVMKSCSASDFIETTVLSLFSVWQSPWAYSFGTSVFTSLKHV
jgi:hypothetical protein